MKRYQLIALAVIFLAGCRSQSKNNCPYEGAECPNAQHYMREYQLELDMDTVTVYDADRIVGRYVNTKWNSQLDSILIEDNR